MRVLLVQPGFPPYTKGFMFPALPEPLSLEILAGYLHNHDVAIADLRLKNNLISTLERFNPDIVATTALTTEVNEAQNVLKQVKSHNPDILTIIGGIHATLVPDDFKKDYVDIIVLGEGEHTLRNIVETYEQKKDLHSIENILFRNNPTDGFTQNPVSMQKLNIDASPLPDREILKKVRKKYFFFFENNVASVESSRGCPFRCKFCSVWKFQGDRCRFMGAERVLQELASINSKEIVFVDDNFLQNISRAQAIYETLKVNGMRKNYMIQARSDTIVKHPDIIEKWANVGLGGVLVGYEAITDDQLKALNKKSSTDLNEQAVRILHQNGIATIGAFIINPNFTADDFSMLKEYIKKNKVDFCQFTVLTPLPGTELYEENKNNLTTHDYSKYDCLHSVLPTKLPIEEFYRQFAELYRSTFPASFKNLFKGLISPIKSFRALRLMKGFGNYRSYLKE